MFFLIFGVSSIYCIKIIIGFITIKKIFLSKKSSLKSECWILLRSWILTNLNKSIIVFFSKYSELSYWVVDSPITFEAVEVSRVRVSHLLVNTRVTEILFCNI